MIKKPFTLLALAWPAGSVGDYKPLESICEVKYARAPTSNIGQPYTEEELIQLCRGANGIITSVRDRFTKKVIHSIPSLKFIAIRNVGYDNIDVQAATEMGVLVSNAPSKHIQRNVAEHTLALILSLAKNLEISKPLTQQGVNRWDQRFNPIYLGGGAVVGMIGFGGIATETARLLRPLKVRILCHTRSITSKNRARRHQAKIVDLKKLLQESDFVSVHTPLTPHTRHLIGEKELGLMKPTAYLINTSRGAIVDEQALIKALKEKTIAGAGLDVVESEPLTPDHVFLNMANVTVTPHIAGRSAYSVTEVTNITIRNCSRMINRVTPGNLVNPEAIELWKRRMEIG